MLYMEQMLRNATQEVNRSGLEASA